MISQNRLEFLTSYVAQEPNVRELLEFYRDEIMSNKHSANSVSGYGILHDPNGLNSIRDMAVLEFINTLLTLNKGVKDGRPDPAAEWDADTTAGTIA